MKWYDPASEKIFVFGSNLAGVHGAGAAKEALKYGALPRQGVGFAGRTYAIPTKDEHLKTLPIPLIRGHVNVFLLIAASRPDLKFFVTRIGCGLAGYKDAEIAPLFAGAPPNCELPEGWEGLEALGKGAHRVD